MMVKGRDLIIYILENHLEDEPICIDDRFLNLMSEGEAAVKFNVGVATIRTWYACGVLDGIRIGKEIYIFPDSCVQTQLELKTEEMNKNE